ncbi:MAG TPA: hypothetical protein VN936_03750, partial [Candidatus Acidoferrum sp.]|nr:hypothetical protein [Candidatus Acidoferrum sp.]
AEAHGWVPRFAVMQPHNVDFASLDAQRDASKTIGYYTGSVKSPLTGSTYNYQIVGADPTKSTVTTKLQYVPIVVRIHFSDGTVLDPTKPGCGDTVSVEDRFFKGPNFEKTALKSNGVNVGTTQINDAFQRAEFWTILKSKNYHLMLTAAKKPVIVDYTAPSGSTTAAGVCTDQKGVNHEIGEIEINAYDTEMQTLATKYAKPTQVPVVLSYNTFETEGGCCVLGYHSAFGTPKGTQTYAVGAYNDAGIFSAPIEDIHAWTHELGELINDPFVNNGTPAWGHVGQVSGCQNNFEVGDPLTGTPFAVTYKGFAYHPQELAFFSWFYRTKSTGTGGEFSFEGTFTSSQGACT